MASGCQEEFGTDKLFLKMKTLSIDEIDLQVATFQCLEGARLQKIYSQQNDLVLEFYQNSMNMSSSRNRGRNPNNEGNRVLWLWLDVHLLCPFIHLFREAPPLLPKQKKPVSLFLNAHAVGQKLSSVHRLVPKGRVIQMSFGAQSDSLCVLEMRLFPHGANIHVMFQGRSIWWHKPPQEPKGEIESNLLRSPTYSKPVESMRDIPTLEDEWLSMRIDLLGKNQGQKNSKTSTDETTVAMGFHDQIKINREKEIQKRKKIIAQIQNEIEQKKKVPWAEVGEWLKQHQSLNVPEEWQEWIKPHNSLAQNITHCFEQARKIKIKLKGTLQRLNQVEEELQNLESGKIPSSPMGLKGKLESNREQNGPNGQNGENSLVKSQRIPAVSPISSKDAFQSKWGKLKLRKKIFANRWTAYLGKSAKDNMGLLRQARPWDLWFHLKDWPSSHGVIFRNRGENLPQETLEAAARWLAQESFGEKSKSQSPLLKGEKLTVLFTECRFVRPIKGDRLGRVTYQEAKQFVIVFG